MKLTKHFKWAVLLLIMLLLFNNNSFAQSADIDTANVLFPRYNTNKKLIEYGWNYPNVDFLLNNMNSLGKRPFQGVVFKPYWPEYHPGYLENIFYPYDVSESYMQLDKLATIKWASTLTDNFMKFWVAGRAYADWFNDEQWKIVGINVRRISKAVAYANAKGIFWDTEHYGSNIWKYDTTLYPNHTLAQVQAKVRQRGFEFMQALSSYKTDITVIATGLWMFPAWDARGNIDSIQNSNYCLLKSFADGMLEAATDQQKIVDGNEISYYWPNTINWHYSQGAYDLVSNGFNFVDPALMSKNDTFKQVGQSVYYTNYKPISSITKQRKLEHNVYNSLLSSDEYVWFYSAENASWWTNPFPEEADSAIRSGYNKLMQGRALGFTIGKDSIITYSNDLQIISPVQNQVFNVGDTIEFKIQMADGINYINYFASYNKLPGFSNPPASKKMLAIYPGTYLVYAYSNGWEKLSNPVTYYVKDSSSRIEQFEEKRNSLVFPNPFGSFVTIQFPYTLKNAEINIINLSGKVVKQVENISGEKITLQIDNLPSGLYLIRLTQDNNTIITDKVIIFD